VFPKGGGATSATFAIPTPCAHLGFGYVLSRGQVRTFILTFECTLPASYAAVMQLCPLPLERSNGLWGQGFLPLGCNYLSILVRELRGLYPYPRTLFNFGSG